MMNETDQTPSEPDTLPGVEGKPSKFWDLYETELVTSVKKKPSEYALKEGESAEDYAKRTRTKMQASGMANVNHTSTTFRRLATKLGIKPSKAALVAAEAADRNHLISTADDVPESFNGTNPIRDNPEE